MKDTEAALKWIVGILRDKKIPFEISGGFAARIYGATRELADIDIDVAGDRLNELAELVKEYSKYGLQHYTDDEFDLQIIQLMYQGQDIDIVPDTVRLFNSKNRQWVESKVDLRKAIKKEIYGITIPVIPVDKLINYKLILGRDVDISDIKELRKLGY